MSSTLLRFEMRPLRTEHRAPRAPASAQAVTTLCLTPEGAGQRLDVRLATALGLSRAAVRGLLERGDVMLDERVLKLTDKGMALPGAGALHVRPYRPPSEMCVLPAPAAESAPPILASGPGWIAIDKPAGMPVHPLREGELATVLGHLMRWYPDAQGVGEAGLRSGVVHRLDVDTSGVLLLAHEEEAYKRLRGAFRQHVVRKRYRAIVEGHFDPPGGELEMTLPLVIARHRPALVRVATEVDQARGRAREVHQLVRPLATLLGATLVEVRPQTGFLHQIRATLAHIGHPVVGDERYATGRNPVEAAPDVGRQMLHAAELDFEEIHARADDPPDFAACLAELQGSPREQAE
jgi:23S rRNA pseudouridine1911/1915/1917 synthase